MNRIARSMIRRKLELTTAAYFDAYCRTYHPPKATVYAAATNTRSFGRAPQGCAWQYDSIVTGTTPEANVIRLEQGRVWGMDGATITREGVLLTDLSRVFGHRSSHPYWSRRIGEPVTRLEGATANLLTAGYNTYYHWLFDVLPRIHLLQRSGCFDRIDRFLLPELAGKFQQETVDLTGIEPSKMRFAKQGRTYFEAEELFVPSLPSLLGGAAPWAIDWLRNLVPQKTDAQPGGKRIYVTRKNARNRRLLNEAEILEIVKGFGFEELELDGMPFADQVQLFRNAEAIAAPHGSGLANIVFCAPGTPVLELMDPQMIVPCFATIAQHLDLDHYPLLDAGAGPVSRKPYWEQKGGDFSFPAKQLLQTLGSIRSLQKAGTGSKY